MRTVKRNPLLSGVFCAVLGGTLLWAGAAAADVTSDRAAGLLVFPKLIFDSIGRFNENTLPADTEIQLTNVSDQQVYLRCFYVNANSHCSNSPENVCATTDDCQQFGRGGLCIEGWLETDFEFSLTPRQPIVWRISEGLTALPLDGAAPPNNSGFIPPVAEDPFFGELKCVEVDETGAPTDRNDLKGEVTIVAAAPSAIDARAYNAIGIEANFNDGDNTLVLGGDDPEYNGCPSVLILDHFFDDAVEPIDNQYVKTHLTLVPCSQDFLNQDDALFDITVQFLVFNEFEQRFSASRKLRCFKEFELCALGIGRDRSFFDKNPASNSCQRSVFSAYVSGTLTGQTRIRGVENDDTEHGHGILGVAEEFYRSSPDLLSTVVSSDAFNLQWAGIRPKADIIQLP
jgi:hypothetical protein